MLNAVCCLIACVGLIFSIGCIIIGLSAPKPLFGGILIFVFLAALSIQCIRWALKSA